jgi:hypothetical protein
MNLNLHRVKRIEISYCAANESRWYDFHFTDEDGVEFQVTAFAPRNSIVGLDNLTKIDDLEFTLED